VCLAAYARHMKPSEWINAQPAFLGAQGKPIFDLDFDIDHAGLSHGPYCRNNRAEQQSVRVGAFSNARSLRRPAVNRHDTQLPVAFSGTAVTIALADVGMMSR